MSDQDDWFIEHEIDWMGVLRTCSSHGGQSKAILGGNLEADIEKSEDSTCGESD